MKTLISGPFEFSSSIPYSKVLHIYSKHPGYKVLFPGCEKSGHASWLVWKDTVQTSDPGFLSLTLCTGASVKQLTLTQCEQSVSLVEQQRNII